MKKIIFVHFAQLDKLNFEHTNLPPIRITENISAKPVKLALQEESENLFDQYMKNLMNYVKLNEILQNQIFNNSNFNNFLQFNGLNNQISHDSYRTKSMRIYDKKSKHHDIPINSEIIRLNIIAGFNYKIMMMMIIVIIMMMMMMIMVMMIVIVIVMLVVVIIMLIMMMITLIIIVIISPPF